MGAMQSHSGGDGLHVVWEEIAGTARAKWLLWTGEQIDAPTALDGLELRDHDEPGFWEYHGYRNYGDPWREQCYHGD
jgi:hypothetical protein